MITATMVRGWDFTRSSRWTFGYTSSHSASSACPFIFRADCTIASRDYAIVPFCWFVRHSQPAAPEESCFLAVDITVVQYVQHSAHGELRSLVSTIDDMETHLPHRIGAEIIAVSLLSKCRYLLWLEASEAWKVCISSVPTCWSCFWRLERYQVPPIATL